MGIEEQKDFPTQHIDRAGKRLDGEVVLEEDLVFQLGDVIADRYVLQARLGSGGMGQVFRVDDRLLENEPLALKLLTPNLAKERQYFARFRNEVILARRLAHPHIVRIFDFGDASNGYHYISMECVDGTDLRRVIENAPAGKLELDAALQVVFQAALALQYAHSCGIVHRDVKPDNLLINSSGLAKLTDFGSARMMRVEKGITNTGELIGTPHYMAPELFRGEKPTPRVDIYSLGILLYEMVCGMLPFQDGSVIGLITKHLNHPVPDVIKLRPDCPRWVQDIIETCAEKEPANRFQSAGEIAAVAAEKLISMGKPLKSPCLPEELGFGRRGNQKKWFGLFRN